MNLLRTIKIREKKREMRKSKTEREMQDKIYAEAVRVWKEGVICA